MKLTFQAGVPPLRIGRGMQRRSSATTPQEASSLALSKIPTLFSNTYGWLPTTGTHEKTSIMA